MSIDEDEYDEPETAAVALTTSPTNPSHQAEKRRSKSEEEGERKIQSTL